MDPDTDYHIDKVLGRLGSDESLLERFIQQSVEKLAFALTKLNAELDMGSDCISS